MGGQGLPQGLSKLRALTMNLKIDSNTVVASFFWGTIGFGFAGYGWKQKDMLPLFGGIALMAISYFIWSALYMSLVGVLLVVGTLWLKKHL
jgi:hypothetical protein